MNKLTLQPNDKFLVTGFYYNSNKKFRMVYSNLKMALSINLWNGHVWLIRDGKRKLLKSVYN